jgi:hypothetical protein
MSDKAETAAVSTVPGTHPAEGDSGQQGFIGSSFLPTVARSKGNNTGSGYVGLDGFSENASGTGTIAGEKLEWTYRADYRHPQCIRRALEGSASLGCDTSPRAGAGASVKHRDREVSFDTSE